MSKQDVYGCISATGIPTVYMAWPEGSAPSMPWVAFWLDRRDEFVADNVTYSSANRWKAQLCQKAGDDSVEASIEGAIESMFGPVAKEEAWDPDESCVITVYSFTESD